MMIDGEWTDVIGRNDAMKTLGVTQHTFYRAAKMPHVRSISVTQRRSAYVLEDIVAAIHSIRSDIVDRPHPGWITTAEFAELAGLSIWIVSDLYRGKYANFPKITGQKHTGKMFFEPDSVHAAIRHYKTKVQSVYCPQSNVIPSAIAPDTLSAWHTKPWGPATKRHHYEADHEN